MLSEYVARARAWFGRAVRDSAVRQFSSSVEGEHLKRGVPVLAAFVAATSVLVGQLSLSAAGWPESFAAFLLASPLITVLLLAGLAACAYPDCSHLVPLYSLAVVALLGSLQALLGAVVSIAPSPPNRVQFALLTAGIVALAVLFLSKRVVADAVGTVAAVGRRTRQKVREVVEERGKGTGRIDDSDDSFSEKEADAD